MRQSMSAWDHVHERIVSYRDETGQIAELAQLSSPSRIVDLACGTGKHIIEFARQGHWCVGVDRHLDKLTQAKQQSQAVGVNARFVCADIRAFSLRNRYNLVLCLYAMSTMRTDSDFLAVLDTARNALDRHGRFIFNVINQRANTETRSPLYMAVHLQNHLRDFTACEVRNLLGSAGLEIRSTRKVELAGIKDLDLQVCATQRETAT